MYNIDDYSEIAAKTGAGSVGNLVFVSSSSHMTAESSVYDTLESYIHPQARLVLPLVSATFILGLRGAERLKAESQWRNGGDWEVDLLQALQPLPEQAIFHVPLQDARHLGEDPGFLRCWQLGPHQHFGKGAA